MFKQKRNGFTIVELLIVIVVIAILAAISIVAYNGIQRRAVDSSINSGLSQTAKKLALHKVEYDTYPATLSQIGIQNTSDVSYQYSFTSSTYCVTASRAQTSKYISNSQQSSQSGSCAGHTSAAVESVTATYLQSSGSALDQASYTFSAQSLSNPRANRTIVVAVAARAAANNTLASVSVAGVPARIDKQYTVGGSISAIASAQVPNGTNGDVAVNFSGTMVRNVIGLYELSGPVDVSSSGEGTNSMSLTGAEKGVVVATSYRANVSSMNWVNAALSENLPVEGSNVGSFATTTSTGPLDISTTGNGSAFSLAGVAYAPKP